MPGKGELTHAEKLLLRRWQNHTNAETDRARDAFPVPFEDQGSGQSMNVLLEEVGKVARCFNKVYLAADDEVAEEWRKELRYRMTTTRSILDRIYLHFLEDGNA